MVYSLERNLSTLPISIFGAKADKAALDDYQAAGINRSILACLLHFSCTSLALGAAS